MVFWEPQTRRQEREDLEKEDQEHLSPQADGRHNLLQTWWHHTYKIIWNIKKVSYPGYVVCIIYGGTNGSSYNKFLKLLFLLLIGRWGFKNFLGGKAPVAPPRFVPGAYLSSADYLGTWKFIKLTNCCS